MGVRLPPQALRKSKYTKKLLAPIVKEATSIAEVLDELDLKYSGGNYRNIKGHITRHNIDMSHFTGSRWNKGKTVDTSPAVKRITGLISYKDSDVFKKNSHIQNRDLIKRLLKEGKKYACEIVKCSLCGIENPTWAEKPLKLHLDHIDGIKNNNERSNLRFICPNCHQQTTTWGNKNNTRLRGRLSNAPGS